MKPDPYRLTKPESESRAWEKVSQYAQAKLAELRVMTEDPDVDEKRRFRAACAIRELKELLKLAEPAKEQRSAASE